MSGDKRKTSVDKRKMSENKRKTSEDEMKENVSGHREGKHQYTQGRKHQWTKGTKTSVDQNITGQKSKIIVRGQKEEKH